MTVIFAMLTCPAAIAQEQVQVDPVSALAERYIVDAQAPDIFVVDTDPAVARPRVRHLASGLRCTLSGQFTAARLQVVEGAAQRGDEVVCSTSNEWVGQSITLKRISSPLTLAQDMELFQADVMGSRGNWRVDSSAPALAAAPGFEEQTVALGNGGAWSYLRVAHVNGWSVRMRISSQQAAFELLSRQANREWEAALRSLAPQN